MSVMSDYWLREATSLQATTEVLLAEIMRLKKYEDTVRFIASDYLELSYDKAQWQRDDWRKRCRKTIAEALEEKYD